MPCELKWYIPDRIIYIRYWGDVTSDEMMQMEETMVSAADNAPGQVHCIADLRHMEKFPIDIKLISRVFNRTFRHPKLLWMVMLSNNTRLGDFLGSMVMQMSGVRHRILHEPAEVVEFFHSVDADLPELPSFD